MDTSSQNFTEPTETALSDREMAFANSYMVSLTKKDAALAIGCPEASAKEQGYQIYNRPHVFAYIQSELKKRTLTSSETVKLVSGIAQSTITDYMKPVQVVRVPQLRITLADYILQKESEIKREELYGARAKLTPEQVAALMISIQSMENELVKLRIELEENPLAFRVVDGQPDLVEEMQLNMAALVADKEKGKVKKIKVRDDGTIEVEMYSAEAAQDKLMKYHGSYAPTKTELTGADGGPIQVTSPSAINVLPGSTENTPTIATSE